MVAIIITGDSTFHHGLAEIPAPDGSQDVKSSGRVRNRTQIYRFCGVYLASPLKPSKLLFGGEIPSPLKPSKLLFGGEIPQTALHFQIIPANMTIDHPNISSHAYP